jgi:hypothetical protein
MKTAMSNMLRAVLLTAQKGVVSTQDIVEIFMKGELYDKIYSGMGSGKIPKDMKLTAEEINSLSFALTAMANTLMECGSHIRKVRARKQF